MTCPRCHDPDHTLLECLNSSMPEGMRLERVPVFSDPLVTLYEGDCIEVMRDLPDASVDSVVCDPPYGLEFMSKEWDKLGVVTGGAKLAAANGKRDARPGNEGGTWFGSREGANPSFTGSPNPPCLNCGGTQRGRDGQGVKRCHCDKPEFPNHRLSQSKAMQAWHEQWATEAFRVLKPGGYLLAFGGTRTYHRLASAIEDAGFEIRDCLMHIYASGFPKSRSMREIGRPELGTALKPAHEPIVMARKPLVGTVAANVTRYGTGALNIGATRIGTGERPLRTQVLKEGEPAPDYGDGFASGTKAGLATGNTTLGRWPSNVLLDPEHPELFDEPNPYVVGSGATARVDWVRSERQFSGWQKHGELEPREKLRDEQDGGYSRFYLIPKAPRAERTVNGKRGKHPTQKPVDLMRHLLKLVTPPGGVALDPFAGSGTTGVAASLEGIRSILIEREPDYVEEAVGRLMATPMGLGLDVPAGTRKRKLTPNDGLGWDGSKRVRKGPADILNRSQSFDDEEPAA